MPGAPSLASEARTEIANVARAVCVRCVMDTTDPDITFDADGICAHCHTYDENRARYVVAGEEGRRRLEQIAGQIRAEGRDKPYDSVVGVSGGVDSTFVAYEASRLGLRPLAVHLDNGWDSELAVSNIQNALERLGLDLQTHVLDWDEFRDLQLAFLRASTPDSEIPSDHAIVALMYLTAHKLGVKYILAGMNRLTESHLPRAWSQGHMDWRYISSVHRRYGTGRLRSYPHLNLLQLQRLSRRHRMVQVLDFGDYRKADAMAVLQRELGWRPYGGKHHESIYTRFYQGVILPTKFGFDKRRVHLSSLICAGQMTREEALEQLRTPPYSEELQAHDRAYVIKKLGLSPAEFDRIMALPLRSFHDYPSYQSLLASPAVGAARRIYRILRPRPGA